MYLREHKGGSGHLSVIYGERKSQLPMHGGKEELGTGLVNKIKRTSVWSGNVIYPIVLEPDDNGTFLVVCPDLPEVTTFGDDLETPFNPTNSKPLIEESLERNCAAGRHDFDFLRLPCSSE